MVRLLSPYSAVLFALARAVIGFLFACHGAQKLFGVLTRSGQAAPLLSQMWFAGVIEFFGGIFIFLGFMTPYIAFLSATEKVWAYFQSHAPRGAWPIQNGGEMAAFYCFFFLYLASVGAGPWSLDGLLRRRQA